jgi:hypothetical protein
MDVGSARFRAGVLRGYWYTVSYSFPVLLMYVASVAVDGASGGYTFRFELTGFPSIAPEVRIWDVAKGTPLAPQVRPGGSTRVAEAFKDWQHGSVYRPWERHAGAHNNWGSSYRDLAWHPARDLAFVLEDLHGLLTSNAAARRDR